MKAMAPVIPNITVFSVVTLGAVAGFEAIQPQDVPQGILYALLTIIMALVGFLIKEVIKRLDKQIGVAEESKTAITSNHTRMRADVDRLIESQRLLVTTVSHLSETVRNIVEVQNVHLRLTQEQIDLAKRWHDKVDRAWNPNLPSTGDES